MKRETRFPLRPDCRGSKCCGACASDANHVCLARRALLLRGALVGALAFGLSLGPVKRAAAKASKGDFFYQDHPNDGKDCAQCRFFAAQDGDAATGLCAIVAGPINRSGWCLAYSPRA